MSKQELEDFRWRDLGFHTIDLNVSPLQRSQFSKTNFAQCEQQQTTSNERINSFFHKVSQILQVRLNGVSKESVHYVSWQSHHRLRKCFHKGVPFKSIDALPHVREIQKDCEARRGIIKNSFCLPFCKKKLVVVDERVFTQLHDLQEGQITRCSTFPTPTVLQSLLSDRRDLPPINSNPFERSRLFEDLTEDFLSK